MNGYSRTSWSRIGVVCCLCYFVLVVSRSLCGDLCQNTMALILLEILDILYEPGRFPLYVWACVWAMFILCGWACTWFVRIRLPTTRELRAGSLLSGLAAIYLAACLPGWRAGGCSMWYPWVSHPEYRNPNAPLHERYLNYCERYQSDATVDVSNITVGYQKLEDSVSKQNKIAGIPMILHQQHMARTAVPRHFGDFVMRCHRHASGFVHVFWEDADFEPFLRAHYPQLWPVFNAMPNIIQKVDTIRYAILHHYGGVYLDADVKCNAPLEEWLLKFGKEHSVFMEPIHMIATQPRHPLWARLISQVIAEAGTKEMHVAGEGLIEDSAQAHSDVLVDRTELVFRPKYLDMLGVSTWRWVAKKTLVIQTITSVSYILAAVSALLAFVAVALGAGWCAQLCLDSQPGKTRISRVSGEVPV